jgi:hypothetical protein
VRRETIAITTNNAIEEIRAATSGHSGGPAGPREGEQENPD